jgi:biotin operon repressor
MKAKELDKRFDAGKDISKYLDLSRARRINEAPKRVNVDFPSWMIDSLDKVANRLGVTRQSIIKIWISERLESAYVDAVEQRSLVRVAPLMRRIRAGTRDAKHRRCRMIG